MSADLRSQLLAYGLEHERQQRALDLDQAMGVGSVELRPAPDRRVWRPQSLAWGLAMGILMMGAIGGVAWITRPIGAPPSNDPPVATASSLSSLGVPLDSLDEFTNAGDASQVGWSILPIEHPPGGEIKPYGRLPDGTWVGIFTAPTAPARSLYRSSDGVTWGSTGFESFSDLTVSTVAVGAGRLWVWTVDDSPTVPDFYRELWVSEDATTFDVVLSTEPGAELSPELENRIIFGNALPEDAADVIMMPGYRGGELYFSRGDAVVVVVYGGLLVSSDGGRTLVPVDLSSVRGSGEVSWAWSTSDGFFLIVDELVFDREDGAMQHQELWWSTDGFDWSLRGEVDGLPSLAPTQTDTVWDTHKVLASDDGLVAPPGFGTAFEDFGWHRSEDGGFTWTKLEAGTPFGLRAALRVEDGWLIGADQMPSGTTVWVSRNGVEWYSLDFDLQVDVGWGSSIFVTGSDAVGVVRATAVAAPPIESGSQP